MTRNQLTFHQLEETKRSNLANESLQSAKLSEDQRSHLASEAELHRSNVAKERETNRSNLAKERENTRSNVAKEKETYRSNLAKETETHRANTADEGLRVFEADQRIQQAIASNKVTGLPYTIAKAITEFGSGLYNQIFN